MEKTSHMLSAASNKLSSSSETVVSNAEKPGGTNKSDSDSYEGDE